MPNVGKANKVRNDFSLKEAEPKRGLKRHKYHADNIYWHLEKKYKQKCEINVLVSFLLILSIMHELKNREK